jgi:hypothetical protein
VWICHPYGGWVATASHLDRDLIAHIMDGESVLERGEETEE